MNILAIEILKLSLSFDALGNDAQWQRPRHLYHAVQQFAWRRLVSHPADKTLIDFDIVENQLVETGKPGIAGAKVVQRDGKPAGV